MLFLKDFAEDTLQWFLKIITKDLVSSNNFKQIVDWGEFFRD